ncbi:hypothetical protein B0A52_09480 [Exophiala mesophila]|uniref:Mannose-6-phosphate isomerase n=1 Tax=Exophiala mesophila TaxID=212818 RepID=A0A438MSN5_EXOME|nr:hypothetical protein B0A52_09480 [Exophiala mesophila]
MVEKVIQLRCSCNNYPWGKKGRESLAARLCEKTNPDFRIDNDKDYAEMWMGTYPELPSYSLSTGQDLQEIINAHQEALVGKSVLDKFGPDLPFLPKILSIAKALPLQIHPNIELATKLHEQDPDKFTDPNHKPEIAVALTKFEAFVGFKNLNDIETLFQRLEPLKQFIPTTDGDEGPSSFSDTALKSLCRNLLFASPDTVASTLKSLRSTPRSELGSHSYISDLIPRLNEQYSDQDNGTLVALLTMNYLVLEPGSALYIPADGIHAYLSGEIVECMARSNNVLNTGFCPRADRDNIDLFVETLSFKQHDPSEPILKRQKSQKGQNGLTHVFTPPMAEFNMLVSEIPAGEVEVVSPIYGPSILVVTQGSGSLEVGSGEVDLPEGAIFFVGHGVEIRIRATEEVKVYRAYVE